MLQPYTFTYNTGRVYNGEQNLIITVTPTESPDEFGSYAADVSFVDNSRYISGRWQGKKGLLIFGSDTPQEFGRVVLKMYDTGSYELI